MMTATLAVIVADFLLQFTCQKNMRQANIDYPLGMNHPGLSRVG